MEVIKQITLKDLWRRKTISYFNASRDKIGVPTKSIESCYKQAQEDYGPQELESFNQELRKRGNYLLSRDQQIVWADGTYDDPRECDSCKASTCQIPTHAEFYTDNYIKEDVENNDELALLNLSLTYLADDLYDESSENSLLDDPETVSLEDGPSYEVPL